MIDSVRYFVGTAALGAILTGYESVGFYGGALFVAWTIAAEWAREPPPKTRIAQLDAAIQMQFTLGRLPADERAGAMYEAARLSELAATPLLRSQLWAALDRSLMNEEIQSRDSCIDR